MNIILGDFNAQQAKNRYTVLELDRFRLGQDGPEESAWCVIETVPHTEIVSLDDNVLLHQSLIANYRDRNWNACVQLIDQLRGLWNGEMDSFYEILLNRVQELQTSVPNDDWSWVIQK